MTHELDTLADGRAAIAYVGEAPWHGLGQALTPGASVQEWTREAGLAFEVERADVEWTVQTDGIYLRPHHGTRDVLFRSDTLAPLGIMSKGYKIVQPAEIMSFFAELAEAGGFTIETAGSLRGGAKVWALAKIGDAAAVLPGDDVRPYLLLATSFDGSLSTTGKFTNIRVVCTNTITAAIESDAGERVVRIPHHSTFNKENVRKQLGIGAASWERWLIRAKGMAMRPLAGSEADAFLLALFDKPVTRTAEETRESTGYRNLMRLFEGAAIGSGLTQGRTRWRMLNAVTEFVDLRRGNSADSRLNAAWFGRGDAMKSRAYDLLAEM